MLSYNFKKNLHLIESIIIILFLFYKTPECFAEEGISSRKIVLATHQPLSGPAHEYSDIGKSSLAFFKYVNDQGGIHGREIELIIFDDQLKPNITLKDFVPFSFKKDLFCIFSGIGNKTNQAIYPFLKQHGIPSFFIGSDLPEWTLPVRKSVFAFLPNADTEARVLGKYITQKHEGQELIIWYSEKPIFLRAVKTLSKNLYGVPAKLLPGKTGRLVAEWELIVKQKPDLLVALGSFSDTIGFLKAAPRLNIPVYTGHAVADSRLPKWLGKDINEQVRVLTAYPLIKDTEHAGHKLHLKILSEYEPEMSPTRWTFYGHAVAELMVEVLMKSGRSLSRSIAINATENIDNWQGKLLPPIFLGTKNHLALTTLRVSQILDDRINHLSDWIDGR
tara:strand:+ start:325 stop:1494 length:1170 start_codon:yes stop_codon:yes gene_type:complete